MKKLKFIIFFILFFAFKANAENCFENGISSGDPNQKSFIIWTKLTCPKNDNNLVSYEVSTDEKFTHIVKEGQTKTNKEKDNTVKVLVENLKPDFNYYYRFSYNNNYSDTGKTITLPYRTNKVKIAFVSCQNYNAGYFTPYKAILELKPDLVVILGDFIYEYPRKVSNSPRFDTTGNSTDLKSYREKYSLYFKDPYLKELLKNIPVIPIWDDHEVVNDYGGKDLKNKNPQLMYDAYKAYFEYLPIREQEDFKIYRNFYIPDLINIALIDGRQYRDKKVCERGFSFECNDLSKNPDLEYLGKEQNKWLKNLMNENRNEWFILANNTILMDFKLFGSTLNFDQWDGFDKEKNDLIEFVNNKKDFPLIVMTGDVHVFSHGNIFFNNKIIAKEYSTASVSSPDYTLINIIQKLIPVLIPNIDFVETSYRGFILTEFSKNKANIKMYAVNSNNEDKGYFLLKEFNQKKKN